MSGRPPSARPRARTVDAGEQLEAFGSLAVDFQHELRIGAFSGDGASPRDQIGGSDA